MTCGQVLRYLLWISVDIVALISCTVCVQWPVKVGVISYVVAYLCNVYWTFSKEFYAYVRPDRQAEASCGAWFYPCIRLCVRSSVTILVNTMFWKQMNRFSCKLAQVIHMAKAWNDQLLGSGGQRSRSHTVDLEAWQRHRFRPLGWVAFLVMLCFIATVGTSAIWYTHCFEWLSKMYLHSVV